MQVNGVWVGWGLGDDNPKVQLMKRHLKAKFSYARALDDSTLYDETMVSVVSEMQGRYGLPVTGIMNYESQAKCGFVKTVPSAPAFEFRNIWFYSAPGSGAPWWVGPSFETGKWCADVLKLNHQPLGYPIGGYMGLLGGDPGLSYVEVTEALGAELEHQLDINPHVQAALTNVKAGRATDIEFWFSGYSQSADGMEDALVRLFGDGGKYELLRDRINGTLQFGNPSKAKTGIARKVRPQWLLAKTFNITTKGDFYAEAPDAIRPMFYAEIIHAETSLSFAGHIVKIALPVILNLFGGIGSLLTGNLGGLINTVKQDVDAHEGDDHERVHNRLVNFLSIRGVLTNIPALIQLLMALPGLQSHGEYHLPKPEFGGRTGIQVACDHVAGFRR